MDSIFVENQHLTNQVQAQARLIERLRAKGLVSFFQRRRIQKGKQGETFAQYLREDKLRNENIQLKKKLRLLQAELDIVRESVV
ncbi:hypothetical protein LCGC14_1476860 [marine sediment metagenome]|uniref:Uncharacterized protein n=1 Tax=marine sediment metagenome TaxID=412755 RepID=A0A0F9MCF5_9ZZZZ